MAFEIALDMAKGKELDLLLVSEDTNPPVCKIIDYGQFRYKQQKKEKQDHEVSASQNYGKIDTKNAVTSVNQLVHRPGQISSSRPGMPIAESPFSGSIDEPENKLSAGDLVQNAPPTQLD